MGPWKYAGLLQLPFAKNFYMLGYKNN